MNVQPIRAPQDQPPALLRLAGLTNLDGPALAALHAAMTHPVALPARAELLSEGRAVRGPMILLSGWAARVRLLSDGRRQLLSFVLPGDVIGNCGFDGPLAASTIAAITPVTLCAAPDADISPTLSRLYAISRAIDEAHLLAQITRLGRFNAYERILDLLLELNERLALAGLAQRDRFAMPLTQEMLADALGLTSVHVNRMLQTARRQGDLRWSGREIALADVAGLRAGIGREPVRVTA